MPGRIAVLLALLLAGCAPAPERPPEQDERFSFSTAHTPYSAAICIARNARAGGESSAEERTVGTSSTEVIVRSRAGEVLAVARVDNDATFSRASIRVTRSVRSGHEAYARQLMRGC